jgi:hypothetical protein
MIPADVRMKGKQMLKSQGIEGVAARNRRLHLAFFMLLLGLCSSCGASEAKKEAQRAALEADKQAAIQQVQKIINQPVRQFAQTADMEVATYGPGWFHDGASKPDFNNVDVRRTQETKYGKNTYVTSNLNPGIVFLGEEVEFNSNTKYFYTDRTLPKKKLSEDEMLEVNRLYRVIGHTEQEISDLLRAN